MMMIAKHALIWVHVTAALLMHLQQAVAQTLPSIHSATNQNKDAAAVKPSIKINRLSLVSKGSNKCLQTNPLQPEAMLMTCSDKEPEQRFAFALSESGKSIVKDHAGRCMQLTKLEANQNSEGDLAKVIFTSCAAVALQEWAFNGNGVLRNDSNKCLDVLGALTADSSKIGAYKCHGGANQIWTAK